MLIRTSDDKSGQPMRATQRFAQRRTPLRFNLVLGETLFYVLLIGFGIVMFAPFAWALSTSLKPDADIFSATVQWIPRQITFEHYIKAFTLIPYGRYFLNSLFLASAGVVTNLFLGALAGYAFARLRFRGNKLLFRALLASMMVPGIVTLIPTFVILRSIPLLNGNDWRGLGGTGLLNTYWAIILPGAVGAFAVFMMRQFFITLPTELGEAARIDGCGEFRIFWNIYLPLALPALATLALFTFQAGWNSFLWPLIVLQDPNSKTIQMGLKAFAFDRQVDYGPLMAASIVAMLPMIGLFVFAQRYFSQGIAFTGSK